MSESTPSRFACPVRLTKNGVTVTSPRTGRTLEVAYAAAPRRSRGRITQACSVGLHAVEFTTDELRELLDAAQRFTDAALAALPQSGGVQVRTPLHGGWFRRRRSR